jgi:hypothetical protein
MIDGAIVRPPAATDGVDGRTEIAGALTRGLAGQRREAGHRRAQVDQQAHWTLERDERDR